MVHGDEGRGRMKQPLLVVAFQGALSHLGMDRLNQSGWLCLISYAVRGYMELARSTTPVAGLHVCMTKALILLQITLYRDPWPMLPWRHYDLPALGGHIPGLCVSST